MNDILELKGKRFIQAPKSGGGGGDRRRRRAAGLPAPAASA